MAGFPTFSIATSGGAGLPRPGTVSRPPGSKLAVAGSSLLKGLKPPKPGINPGVGSAGSSLAGTLAKGLTHPPAPPPSGGGGAPAAAASQPGGSPLDSTYYGNIANYLFKTNNAINADNLKIANYRTSLQSALGQLDYQQPRSALALEQRANLGGGLYSSVEQQNQADLAQKFLSQRVADESKYGNAIQGLTSAIAAMQQGVPLYENEQGLAAAQRAAAAAQANPAAGQVLPTPAPAPAGGGGGGGGVRLNPGVGRAGGALLGAGVLSRPQIGSPNRFSILTKGITRKGKK